MAHVPADIAVRLAPLYAARGRKVLFETESGCPPSGHETVRSRFDASRGVAWISLDRVAGGSFDAIQAAIQALESSVSAATLFIDLPIDDPGCCGLAASLLSEGLRLAGIGPRFRAVDDERRAEDVLRFQANPAPVDLAGLVVEGDLGRGLADTVLGSEGSIRRS